MYAAQEFQCIDGFVREVQGNAIKPAIDEVGQLAPGVDERRFLEDAVGKLLAVYLDDFVRKLLVCKGIHRSLALVAYWLPVVSSSPLGVSPLVSSSVAALSVCALLAASRTGSPCCSKSVIASLTGMLAVPVSSFTHS